MRHLTSRAPPSTSSNRLASSGHANIATAPSDSSTSSGTGWSCPSDPHHTDSADVLGFVGRRNPTKTSRDFAGPKYLNTQTTTAFTKRRALFGYAEGAGLLAHGALPVIVEGPMDA